MSGDKPGIAAHYLRYSIGNALVILAGLVSFPVLTRLLDNTQYGILGYYDTWVLMAIAIGKLGAQHAILRFYPHGGDRGQLRAFSTNLFYLPLALSLALWAAAAVGLAVADMVSNLSQSPVFWMALFAVPISVFGSQVQSVLRATENSRLVMLTRVAWRWLELVFMLSAVLWLQQSAVAAYAGKLLAAALVFVYFLRWTRKHLAFSRDAVHLPALREGLVYGLPLVANEIVAVSLISLDRLMLKGMLGEFAAVGIYSIGISLAMQVNVFTNATVFEAFAPSANRLYLTQGAASVRALKAKILPPMTYAAVGIALLLGIFGTDLIIALSGADKAASGPVFQVAGVVYALQPLLMVAGYGLLLEKRSTKVLALMCLSLAVNAGLNLWWIPLYGVIGSVYATAVSTFLLGVGHCIWTPRALLQLPDRRTTFVAVTATALCIALVWSSGLFGLGRGWPRLTTGGGMVAMAYAMAVLACDARIRTLVQSRLLSRMGRS